MTEADPGDAAPAPPDRRPELVLAALVLGLGVFVIAGTADVAAAGSTVGLGPRFFPLLVGAALIVIGVCYVVDVLRGGRGDPEESEDIDTSVPSDWRAVVLVGGIFLAFAVLVDLLGWIIAGALLFGGVAWALGARRPARTAAVAVVLSISTYLIFVKGLGVTLPGGLLEGVI
ncbi:tripartite tricarboxylate transporter TctB family protein [Sphaerisporangium sp. TRM90804]|uniref:tripartite tricarboxylate transporter TctB family protein n=1 Tax=Sphaerisporangium sp. TRM90804 TaxID=3031113 RepID=UPI0024493CD1|nr:tripartite tricarboxylate transporter TctB family protein [Sphaerisporangium sp. TRM90804]MDH2429255.1 tripartite tricarboxylate transporter TctB family protein [Sphaerisporangium sp. TRM90804]